MRGIYVTGTDTGVGKTVVCGLLAAFLQSNGVRAATQKWVETGCDGEPSDLSVHRRLMGVAPDTSTPPDRCPYRFPLPASPHLAAARAGRTIEAPVIEAAYGRLAASYDIVLVEGTGGFLVPLSEELLAADLAAGLGLCALVVVRNRLGCINHAALTAEAIRLRGIPLLGLVFNRPSEEDRETPAEVLEDNPRVVGRITGVPVMGELPHLDDLAEGREAFAPVGRAILSRWRPG
jgi:dethiobiotin synthetase